MKQHFSEEDGIDRDFWTKKYLQGRPNLAEATLQRIWKYHADKGGSFGLCHEPGAGSGVHTRRIAEKFESVVASDLGAAHVALGKERHADLPNVEFRVGNSEDPAGMGLQKASVDLVLAINFIHFVDTDAILRAVDYQLKPGGTFAVLAFCQVFVLDQNARQVWNQLWNAVCHNSTLRQGHDSVYETLWYKKAACGYDHLPLPESIFEPGAVRFRSGSKDNWPDAYLAKNVSDPLESGCGKNDILMTDVDTEDWKVEVGVSELRKLLYSVIPFEETDEVAALWKQLEDELQDRRVECLVPVTGILATKKR
ncbi:hypothetical protein CB0940_04668 [Cercospora beticola]|uniref:Methyltransferase type 11 domain-containing protein n=1 Tax=Cercospora beticola TaxID=122368 RepID=A0A2G5HM13_CERBT|nr:hypothetical protein CB0940_04668 [Cercospora beticola]PIA93565.1 hypothetical protein CB0940_04668 [Cercospora beticola]WPB01928.1 hypothetical protein RHO25_006561 [Cercospora beticola]CAK1363226.1 unnamed protein product [Cercospora beticola]